MNYKNIFKSKNFRTKLLQVLSFIPDKPMIKMEYWIKTGRRLNLNFPKRYSEKIQWYKLNYKDPKFIQCVDKYDVRKYIEDHQFQNILTKCYGVFDSPNDIDISKLPDKFVLKDTLAGGGTSVIICKDKSSFDFDSTKIEMQKWCNKKLRRDGGREWPYYSGKKHRIIAEEYLECANGDLPDYKFFCFNGKCACSFVRVGYSENHNINIQFFDENQNPLKLKMDYSENIKDKVNLPKEYNEMQRIAEELSKEFPHVRVDLYDVDGRILFGELTFYHASGFFMFEPDSYDYVLGDKFVLPNKMKR